MFDYIAIRIDTIPTSETITDLLAAYLADEGFESFEPDKTGLTAYIRKDIFEEDSIKTILEDFPMDVDFKVTKEEIKGEDWNQEWEQNYFEPISIDKKCVIRSSFHKNAPYGEIEIIIDPKMAFGTGHHFTTANMVRLLLKEDLKGKDVIDMGTGTGILAILSKKLGAKNVTGIEIDPYALENAEENGMLNNENINWICGDAQSLKEPGNCDVFLANINRNVILEDLKDYVTKLRTSGKVILSGFYESDMPLIEKKAKEHNLKKEVQIIDNEWVAAIFIKE